ncbi:MAG: HD domain-containing protein [Candidatus Micrarchaeia archaeon]
MLPYRKKKRISSSQHRLRWSDRSWETTTETSSHASSNLIFIKRIPIIEEAIKITKIYARDGTTVLFLLSYLSNIGNNPMFGDEDVRHSVAVARLAASLGKKFELRQDELEDMICAGLLHDIGKQELSVELLRKPKTEMKDVEWNTIQQHSIASAVMASKVLKNLLGRMFSDKRIEKIVNAIHFHHERFDGSGYPFHIAGREIPLYSRIIAVVDVYDALTNPRPYRNFVYTSDGALQLLYKERKKYDRKILDSFRNMIRGENSK